jgi:hypothetical protein
LRAPRRILNDEKFERTSHPVIVVKLRILAAYLARLFDGISQDGRGSGGGNGRYASYLPTRKCGFVGGLLAEFLKVAVLKEYLVRRLERAAMSLDSCQDRVVSLRCPGGGYGRTGDWNGSGDRKSDD